METTNTAVELDTGATPEPRRDSVVSQEENTPLEVNGPKGPEPTRFGDWERKGRCVDF